MLNTIVADSLEYIADRMEKLKPDDFAGLTKILSEVNKENKQVFFSGNGYSEEWHAEAAKRGLENLPTTPDALPSLISEQTVAAFAKYDVLSERELHSRYDVLVEQYIITVNIEAETAATIARTLLFPAAARYIDILDEADLDEAKDELHGLASKFYTAIRALEAVNATHEGEDGSLDHATYLRDTVLPAMIGVREIADQLEKIVPDDLWPLPKYSEILFIK